MVNGVSQAVILHGGPLLGVSVPEAFAGHCGQLHTWILGGELCRQKKVLTHQPDIFGSSPCLATYKDRLNLPCLGFPISSMSTVSPNLTGLS